MFSVELFAATMTDGEATIYSTVFSTVVAVIFGVVAARMGQRYEGRREIRDGISKLIDLTMEYPFVEEKETYQQWGLGTQLKSPQMVQYDNYCCFVFNLINTIWDYCGTDRSADVDPGATQIPRQFAKAIERHLNAHELITTHRRWWIADSKRESVLKYRSYSPLFIIYVDSIVQATADERNAIAMPDF